MLIGRVLGLAVVIAGLRRRRTRRRMELALELGSRESRYNPPHGVA